MPIVAFRGENAAYKKELEYCNKVMKKHFNKYLIRSEKQEEQFQSTAGTFTSFFGYELVRLNAVKLFIGGNWKFFLKMCLKLEFIISFRCTQDTHRLTITRFISKIIDQRVKLGTFVSFRSLCQARTAAGY